MILYTYCICNEDMKKSVKCHSNGKTDLSVSDCYHFDIGK